MAKSYDHVRYEGTDIIAKRVKVDDKVFAFMHEFHGGITVDFRSKKNKERGHVVFDKESAINFIKALEDTIEEMDEDEDD